MPIILVLIAGKLAYDEIKNTHNAKKAAKAKALAAAIATRELASIPDFSISGQSNQLQVPTISADEKHPFSPEDIGVHPAYRTAMEEEVEFPPPAYQLPIIIVGSESVPAYSSLQSHT